MAASGKKAFEKRAGWKLLRATGFLRRYGLLAFEQPDLLACHNGAVFGIEVSRLFQDEGERGKERHRVYAQRRRLLREAQVRHRERCTDAVDLLVEFRNGVLLDDDQQESCIEALLETATELPEQAGEQLTLTESPLRRAGLADSVAAVRATRYEGEDGPLWGMVGEPWTADRVSRLLQHRLDQKEQRLAHYRQDGVLAHWLLLVCDAAPGKRLAPPHPCAADGVFHSSFQRVFVIDFTGRHCNELTLDRPPQQP